MQQHNRARLETHDDAVSGGISRSNGPDCTSVMGGRSANVPDHTRALRVRIGLVDTKVVLGDNTKQQCPLAQARWCSTRRALKV
jgi:hypothetical protein